MRKQTIVLVVSVLIAAGAGVALGHQWSRTAPAVTTTSQPAVAQPTTAIWPYASSATRFGDPVTAARAFATEYLGFTSPIIGAFQRGDTRSGEVPVRASANGVVTTILVRQVTSDDSWWILGATSPDIVLTTPSALAAITSPVHFAGRSTAFEAVVNVAVRQDGATTPLATGTVHGGSMGVMGPFSSSLPFTAAPHHAGAIVLWTVSAKDGSVVTASALRVAFHA